MFIFFLAKKRTGSRPNKKPKNCKLVRQPGVSTARSLRSNTGSPALLRNGRQASRVNSWQISEPLLPFSYKANTGE